MYQEREEKKLYTCKTQYQSFFRPIHLSISIEIISNYTLSYGDAHYISQENIVHTLTRIPHLSTGITFVYYYYSAFNGKLSLSLWNTPWQVSI